MSGTATINRTLLHHQQTHGVNGVAAGRNGAATGTLRGLAISSNSSDSPPPDYNIVVHDNSDRHGLLYFFFSFSFVLFPLVFV